MAKLEIIRDDPSFRDGPYDKKEDAFDHEAFAETLSRVIDDNDPPLTVGLFGGWGVGKSTIVNLLSKKCSQKGQSYVYFNAWQYSGDSFRRQFLLAVAGSDSMIPEKTKREETVARITRLNYSDIKGRQTETFRWSKAGLKNLGVFLFVMTIGVLFIIYGGWAGHLSTLGAGIFALVASLILIIYQRLEQVINVQVDTAIDPQLIFPEQFTKEFNGLIDQATNNKPKQKIVIVVDDLDRCDVSTIKNILVSMKNFLGNRHCTFVVPMDDSSVVQMFEEKNTNFGYEQLRKYFSVALRIPALHEQDILAYARRIAKQYGIDQDIVYIAALGYCLDARKMKHFLNLFKLKFAVAEERAKKGLLGEVKPEAISPQLAKLAVLEYQFPEFFHYVSLNPDMLQTFTDCARDIKVPDQTSVKFQEISPSISSLEEVWHCYPGLKRFLMATYTISIDNYGIISRLKTTTQEYESSELGKLMRKALEYGEELDVENHVKEGRIAENSQSVTDTLVTILDSEFKLPVQNAARMTLRILATSQLTPENQSELLRTFANVYTKPNSGVSLLEADVPIVLDNIQIVAERQQRDLMSRIVNERFDPDKYYPEFWRVMNHPVFANACRDDQGISNRIITAHEKWYPALAGAKEKISYFDDLSNFKLTEDERKSAGLIFPSANLIQFMIKDISSETKPDTIRLNATIAAFIFDESSPLDTSVWSSTMSAKLSEIVQKAIEDQNSKLLFDFACKAIIEMNAWLISKDAVEIANNISTYYATIEGTKARLDLLGVFVVCYASLSEKAAERSSLKSTYDGFIADLSPREFRTHITQVGDDFGEENRTVHSLIADGIKNRWKVVLEESDSPTVDTIENARICKANISIIGEAEYEVLIDGLLALTNAQSIGSWTDFLVEVLREKEEKILSASLQRMLAKVESSDEAEETRLAYGKVVIELLKVCQVGIGLPIFESLFGELATTDHTVRGFVVEHFDFLKNRFGDSIPIEKAPEVFESIVGKENLSEYEGSVDILMKYSMGVPSSGWSKLARRINADLANEELDVRHRVLLLHLALGMSAAEGEAEALSKTLYDYKESGAAPELRRKAWEVYEPLTREGVISSYTPPSRSIEPGAEKD